MGLVCFWEWGNLWYVFCVLRKIVYLCDMDRRLIVNKIAEIIRAIVPDSRVVLYGSTARGTFREDSDIDVLVVLPDAAGSPSLSSRKIEITDSLYDVELEYGVTVSPLIVLKSMWERMTTPFTSNVELEGVVI